MTQYSWEKLRKIVDKALDLEGDERLSFLDSACADDVELRKEVDSLLAQEEPSRDFIEDPILTRSHYAPKALEPAPLPDIQGYEILHEIGRGGMARVYEARRNESGLGDLRLAIKVLRRHMLHAEGETAWRFRHERRILAGLDHPNIARIFDGGTTEDGLPYFVMEYVEGEPLDSYCNSQLLTVRQRVEIFRKICAAVDSAHRKLVVHRDLKPNNILVTAEREPKLLDFGIAKLLDNDDVSGQTTWHMTLPGVQPMTPSYASPEQFMGEAITVASDVYSLGVVLYELLTGHNPHRIEKPGLEQFRQAVLYTQPELPSQVITRAAVRWTSHNQTVQKDPETIHEERGVNHHRLHRDLAGDLDKILLKTLRKEPDARYRSALKLSEDLENYLVGLPVAARKGEFWYRTRKLLRLHRSKVAAALLIFLGLIGLFFHQQRVAHLEAQNRIAKVFVTSLVTSSENPEASNPVEDFLAQNAGEILSQLNDLGSSMAEGGELETAESILRAALDMKRERFGDQSDSVATGIQNLASVLTMKGEWEGAEDLYLQALAIWEGLYGEDALELSVCLGNLAAYYQDTGRLEDAQRIQDRLSDINRTNNIQPTPPQLNNLGYTYLLQAKANPGPVTFEELGKAEEIYRDLHAITRGTINEFKVLKNLAEALRLQGKTLEAVEIAKEAHRAASMWLLSPDMAEVESVLGASLADAGQEAEALPHLERAQATLLTNFGDTDGRTIEARELLEKVRARLEANPPPAAPAAGSLPPNPAAPPR